MGDVAVTTLTRTASAEALRDGLGADLEPLLCDLRDRESWKPISPYYKTCNVV